MNRKNLSKRAELLHLSSVSLAEGMRNGTFRSLYRGTGVEFSGVREYLAGDDVRAIDWNVTARMGKPFVKMFDEEKELDVFLVADKSFSMDTGSGIQSRYAFSKACTHPKERCPVPNRLCGLKNQLRLFQSVKASSLRCFYRTLADMKNRCDRQK